MRTTIALVLLGLTAALAGKSAPADELRLRQISSQRLVIEARLVAPAATSAQLRPSAVSRTA